MLDKFAAFLGTTAGFWATMLITLLSCVILVRDNHAKKLDTERDKALHKKIDGLIEAIDKADNRLKGIEPEERN